MSSEPSINHDYRTGLPVLREFKHVFGKPRAGLHRYRAFGVASVDLGLTMVASYVLSKRYSVDILPMFLALMFLGIIVHLAFGVDTTLNRVLFGRRGE